MTNAQREASIQRRNAAAEARRGWTQEQREAWAAQPQTEANRAQRSVLADCAHSPQVTEVVDGPWVCCDCWNASIAARKAVEDRSTTDRKAAAEAWWAARGIRTGDEVKRGPNSEIGMILGLTYRGKARAGKNGPWVQIGPSRTQYDPNGWVQA